MNQENSAPRALLVGAYERDNFGDLLFLLVTEHYLHAAGVETVASAPFAADMTALLDQPVHAYGPLLAEEHFDQVWSVGGEVGAVSGSGAYRMSMPADVYATFKASPAAVRDAMLREATGGVALESAYMPRLSAYPRNAGALSILNSVGLSGILNNDAARRAEVLDIIREAGLISVRDHRSSDMLTEHGIAHRLVPDLVHSITLNHPRPGLPGSGPVLVQISDEHVGRIGHEAFGESLARIPEIAALPVRFFLAGTAVGHDSVESYERIIAAMLAVAPDRDVAILDARRPWDLVDAMATAKLWIGTSLHCRIISAAYSVPRVGLARRKLNVYSRTWDDVMPFEVELADLPGAVATALSPAVAASAADLAMDLATAAENNVRDVIERAGAIVPGSAAAQRVAVLENRRKREIAALRAAVAERDKKLKQLEASAAAPAPAPAPAKRPAPAPAPRSFTSRAVNKLRRVKRQVVGPR